jgi:hypothetical protein
LHAGCKCCEGKERYTLRREEHCTNAFLGVIEYIWTKVQNRRIVVLLNVEVSARSNVSTILLALCIISK